MVGRTLEHLESRKHELRWWTLAVLGLSLVVIGLDNTILNVAIPTLQREFGASGSQLQWMVDSYILVFAVLLLPMGALADRLGRKRLLQGGLGLFAAASAGAAFSDAAWQLIAARGLMGVGGAMIMPATLSIVTDVFPRGERAKAIGIWAAVAGLGIGLGPLLGGALIESLSWGWIFLVNVPIGLAAIGLGLALVPDSRDPDARRLDLPGITLSTAALGAFVYGIIEGPVHGWTSPGVVWPLVGSALLGYAFIAWQRRARQPMVDIALFRDRRFAVGAGAISVAFLSLFGATFLLTQYLQFVRGFSPLEAGMRVAPIALGLMTGAGASHRIVARLGPARVIAGGLAVLAVALASISTWSSSTADWQIIVTLIAVAFAMGNVVAPATDKVMAAVPEARAGLGSAMNDVTRQVGGAIGVALIGSIAGSVYSDRVKESLGSLPDESIAAAADSIGAASQLSSGLAGSAGETVATAAQQAFLDGLGWAVIAAAAIALAGAVAAFGVLRERPVREHAGEAVGEVTTRLR